MINSQGESLVWRWTDGSRAHLFRPARAIRTECSAYFSRPIIGSYDGCSKAMVAGGISPRGFCRACQRIEAKIGGAG
ncbi:MAG: hypothetical protein IT430_04010 [Phycisphaerales bacterium]|nr:hypothetical protein [Phycisphaerales bacterium]